MKKLLVIFLIIGVSVLPTGCAENTSNENHSDVAINLPTDDTVNGYRLGAPKEDNNDTVTADHVTAESKVSTSQQTESSASSYVPVNIQYCANTKSYVFHKTTCGSAKNMNDENKYIASNREELISDGYTPCGKCKP